MRGGSAVGAVKAEVEVEVEVKKAAMFNLRQELA